MPVNPRPWLVVLAAVVAVLLVWATAFVITFGQDDDLVAEERHQPDVAPPTRTGTTEPTEAAATEIAAKAANLAATEPIQAVRLQLIAFELDPNNQRLALVQLLARADDPAPSVKADVVLPASGPIVSAQLSAQGETLLTRTSDGATQLWDLSDPNRVQLQGTIPSAKAVAIDQDASTIVVAQADTTAVWRAHRLVAPRPLATLDQTAVDVVAISADGTVAVTATGTKVTIWVVGIAVSARSESTVTTTAPITAAAFAANGRTLVLGDTVGGITTISLSDPRQPSVVQTLTGHTGKITQIGIAGDNTSVVSVDEHGGIAAWTLDSAQRGDDGARLAVRPAGEVAVAVPLRGGPILLTRPGGPASVWLWTTPEPERWFTLPFPHPQPVASLLSGNGSRAITVGAQGHITIWALDPVVDALANPGQAACQLVGQPSQQQWRDAVGGNIPYRDIC